MSNEVSADLFYQIPVSFTDLVHSITKQTKKPHKTTTKIKSLKLGKSNSYQGLVRSLGNTSKCNQSRKMK